MQKKPDTNATGNSQRIVLIGGGHTHSLVLRAHGMNPLANVEMILVSEDCISAYSGMLPAYIAGLYPRETICVDLVRLAFRCQAGFVHGAATSIDLNEKTVIIGNRPPLSYDILSLNLGSAPDLTKVPGALQQALPIKPAIGFIQAWEEISRVQGKSTPEFIVVGGGAGGVEVSLAIIRRFQGRAKVTLVQSGAELMPNHNTTARRLVEKALLRRGVKVLTKASIVAVMERRLVLATGEELPFDHLLWTTQGAAPVWLSQTGLQLDSAGFIRVNARLQCLGQDHVFAVGDTAALADPRPKAGVFAVRQAKPLMHNLKALSEGKQLKDFHFQKDYLALLGTGDGRAVATRGPFAAAGSWAWRLKTRIDERFMDQFLATSPPSDTGNSLCAPAVPKEADILPKQSPTPPIMRCYGCGSKLPGSILRQELQRLVRDYPDVVHHSLQSWGLAESEDASLAYLPAHAGLLQSIDFFPALVSDPFLAGQLAVVHSFSDIIVKRGHPHSAHLLAVLPPSDHRIMASDFRSLLCGVAEKLREMKATLVGGHTLEGTPLSVGLSVNGLLLSAPLRKESLQAGDRLILTKALGVGLIFAALHQDQCDQRAYRSALASMLRSSHDLLPILKEEAVHAGTDITGFGLVGHLSEMLQGTSLHVHLDPGAIPLLPHVIELVQKGVQSSLGPANSQVLRTSQNIGGLALDDLRSIICCDPQTCGGFLLSVGANDARRILQAIRDQGFTDAAIIGEVSSFPRPSP